MNTGVLSGVLIAIGGASLIYYGAAHASSLSVLVGAGILGFGGICAGWWWDR